MNLVDSYYMVVNRRYIPKNYVGRPCGVGPVSRGKVLQSYPCLVKWRSNHWKRSPWIIRRPSKCYNVVPIRVIRPLTMTTTKKRRTCPPHGTWRDLTSIIRIWTHRRPRNNTIPTAAHHEVEEGYNNYIIVIETTILILILYWLI